MRCFRQWTIRLLMLSFILVGCSAHKGILPLHDEVLIYDLPFDVTFLRAYEALEAVQDWDIELTEKERGIIQVRNVNYQSWNDSDKRVVVVWIDRKNRFQTQVQIAPEYQRVIGSGKLLETISQYLAREL